MAAVTICSDFGAPQNKAHFILIFLAALGCRCCVGFFSGCGACGLLASFDAPAPHRSGVSCGKARVQGVRASVVTAPRLQSTGSVVRAHGRSCCAACETFPDQG